MSQFFQPTPTLQAQVEATRLEPGHDSDRQLSELFGLPYDTHGPPPPYTTDTNEALRLVPLMATRYGCTFQLNYFLLPGTTTGIWSAMFQRLGTTITAGAAAISSQGAPYHDQPWPAEAAAICEAAAAFASAYPQRVSTASQSSHKHLPQN